MSRLKRRTVEVHPAFHGVRDSAVCTLLVLLSVLAGCADDSTGPTTGSLRVTTLTTGDLLDGDGYTLTVGETEHGPIGINDTVMIAGAEPGEYMIELGDVAADCALRRENPRVIGVVAGDTAEANFEIDCAVALYNKIAFTRIQDGDTEIYVMDADGSNPTNLTNSPSASEYYPAWSPDGTRIAFTKGDGVRDVYVMNTAGGNERQLTQDDYVGPYPAWSPDGTKIAYSSGGEIFVMDTDGSNAVNITNHPDGDYEPAWSPDGSRIAFASGRESEIGWDIWVMEADGSNPVRLTDVNDPQTPTLREIAGEPAWSPDGTRIAFSSDTDGFGVYVMDADGSNLTKLVHTCSLARPSWSPDGTRIAYYDCGYEVWVVEADGSNPTNLTGTAGGLWPAWGPSGE